MSICEYTSRCVPQSGTFPIIHGKCLHSRRCLAHCITTNLLAGPFFRACYGTVPKDRINLWKLSLHSDSTPHLSAAATAHLSIMRQCLPSTQQPKVS